MTVHSARVDSRPLGRLIALCLGVVILVYGPRDSSSLLPSDKSHTGPSFRDSGGRTTDGLSASWADVTYDAWVLSN